MRARRNAFEQPVGHLKIFFADLEGFSEQHLRRGLAGRHRVARGSCRGGVTGVGGEHEDRGDDEHPHHSDGDSDLAEATLLTCHWHDRRQLGAEIDPRPEELTGGNETQANIADFKGVARLQDALSKLYSVDA